MYFLNLSDVYIIGNANFKIFMLTINNIISKNLLVSAMHFQDAYNFDLGRVSQCLVHYGVVDPDNNSKILEVPFCAMNTIHRARLEERLAIPGAKAEKPQVITERIESYVKTLK